MEALENMLAASAIQGQSYDRCQLVEEQILSKRQELGAARKMIQELQE